MKYVKLFIAPGIACLLLLAIMIPLASQNEIVLTLSVPGWVGSNFSQSIFEDFEAEHPGVKVVIVPLDNESYVPPAAYGIEEHLDGIEKYVQQGDVVYVFGSMISPEGTRAGYFLDLSPLVQSAPDFDVEDFIPSVWQAYQWDRGIWAVPFNARVDVLAYDPVAFDEAGLSYPNENWTLDDLINAAETLTQYDAEGNVELPGLMPSNPGSLIRSLVNQPFYDEAEMPSPPLFNQPELPGLLERWEAISEMTSSPSGFNFDEIPLLITGTWRVGEQPFSNQERVFSGSLLPGGGAILYADAFAVSSGTQYPELAFELANYLSKSPQVTAYFFGDTPARRSMIGVQPEGGPMFMRPDRDEETQAILDRAFEVALSPSQLRYADYLNRAIQLVNEDGIDYATALQEVQAEAEENLAIAAARRADVQIVVATPIPTPVIGADQIVIQFGMNVFMSPLPNQQDWDRAKEDFLASHPNVGNIDFVTSFTQEAMDTMDCYIQSFNPVPSSQYDTSDILNLDPFMDADPTFDPNDFAATTLDAVRRDGRTWAYPMTMQPAMLWYDSPLFEQANLVSPEGGWSAEAFEDTLYALRPMVEENDPVFVPESFGAQYMRLLIAAYGGMPYDDRVAPAAFNLDDPTNVNAIREVLDLAREGLIEYQELGSFFGGGGGFFGMQQPPIIADTFSLNSFRLSNRNNENFETNQRITYYPRGSRYVPVAYDLSVAMISANAQDSAACYDWISMIAQNTQLVTGVPVRRTVARDPEIGLMQGEDVANLYEMVFSALEEPNALVLSGQFGGGSSISPGAFLEPTWMYRAFDAYVLEGADLEAELALAQENIASYRNCTDAIEIVDTTQFANDQEGAIAYFRQFIDCGVAITPELRQQFSFYYQDVD